MSKSCKGLAMELVKCLSETDCVKVDNRSYKECAGEKTPSISAECVGLRETYFNCKRGQANVSVLDGDTCRIPSMPSTRSVGDR
ncbi:cytochrome C oxidase assembly protein PET191 [Medicago truncatula]|uniref:Cytochrome C oxidase assembly protein PET191 n=1 Tax=Medicago truncatula TaxID=3880 RepID=G7ITI9_MEDTR|nr:cytochrome C oxidase assembly protein PET191 [Medicago truncatula]